MAINNQLFLYSLDGECIKDASFSANIVNIAQDKEVVLLTMENSTVISYNWQNGETVDEVNNYSSNDDEESMTTSLKVEQRSASIVIVGEKSGDLHIFRQKAQ